MQVFPVRNAPIQAGLTRQLLVVIPVALFSFFMVLTGAGLFWTLLTISFVAIIFGQLVVRQWSQPHSVAISDRGLILHMAAGSVTYEWRDLESVGVRTLKEYGLLLGLLSRLSGANVGLPFVHVGLRRALRLHPFGIALRGRVPFVRSLGFYLDDAEQFVAAARAHLAN